MEYIDLRGLGSISSISDISGLFSELDEGN